MTYSPFKKVTFALMVICLLGSVRSAVAQSRDEIINASYFAAFGRFANSGEVKYWRQNIGNKNIAQMVQNHREFTSSNKSERENVVRQSYRDAFGWEPSTGELNYWSPQNKNYVELMLNHVGNWLVNNPDKRKLVISQSYYKVFGRPASNEELKYWMSQAPTSFIQLVAMHTTWKKQNKVSSGSTTPAPNLNENNISTATLSSSAIAGVVASGGANAVAAGGANVIAPGGGNVITGGGANVVAAGGLN